MIQLLKMKNNEEIYGKIIDELDDSIVVSLLNRKSRYIQIQKQEIEERKTLVFEETETFFGIPLKSFQADVEKGKVLRELSEKYSISIKQVQKLKIYLALMGKIKYKNYTQSLRESIVSLYKSGNVYREIAEKLNVTRSIVDIVINNLIYFNEIEKLKWKKRNEIKANLLKPKSLKTLYKSIDVDEFIKDYDNMGTYELSNKYHLSRNMLKFILNDLESKEKIKRHRNPNWKQFKKHPEFLDRYYNLKDRVIEDYNNGLSLLAMMNKYDVPYNRVHTVVSCLIEDGLLEKRNNFRKTPIDFSAFIKDMNKLSVAELANKYERAEKTILMYKSRVSRGDIPIPKKFATVDSQMALIDENEYIKVYPNMTIKQMMHYFGVREVAIRKMRDKLVNENKIIAKRGWIERIKA